MCTVVQRFTNSISVCVDGRSDLGVPRSYDGGCGVADVSFSVFRGVAGSLSVEIT